MQGSHVTATGTHLCELFLLSSLKNEELPHYGFATSEQALGTVSSPESLFSLNSCTTVVLGDGGEEYHASHVHQSSRKAGSLVAFNYLDVQWEGYVPIYIYYNDAFLFQPSQGRARVLYTIFISIAIHTMG